MKKSILLLAFIILTSVHEIHSQNRSIQFIEKPWSEILALAKQEQKLIFLDAYATWCGPCKWMAANIFTNDTVADYYNKTFICVSMDMEKGEGKEIRTSYAVQYFPTLLFINQEGVIMHMRVGAARQAADYINMGNTALNPQENLSSYLKRYHDGEISDGFIQPFLQRLSEAYLPVNPVINKYFSGKSDKEMLYRSSWSIISKYVNDMNDHSFGYLVKHQHEYAKLYGKDSVDNKISGIYLDALMKQTRNASATDTTYIALKQKIIRSGFDGAGKVIFTADLNSCQMNRDNRKFLDMSYEGIEKYYADDYTVLNNVARIVSGICSDKSVPEAEKYLEKALSWSKKSISIKSEPSNNDTYASLLFRMGNTKEAIMYEQTAISLAKNLSLSTKEYEEKLRKMESSAEIKKP